MTTFHFPLGSSVAHPGIRLVSLQSSCRNYNLIEQLASGVVKTNPVGLRLAQLKVGMERTSAGSIVRPEKRMLTRLDKSQHVSFRDEIRSRITRLTAHPEQTACQIGTAV